ncbi:MAG: hypothetical protein IAI48_09885, partial [Candidatus Eremiobacteraeota bacterium]|nr:hypothetical protein [Candidatus Eremiobacteraeota bacterium]
VLLTEASHAGAPSSGIAASAPQAAEAAVIRVGSGVGFGPHRYYRYAYRGGAWTNVGFYYGTAPGYVPGGYYVGYGPPAYGYGYGPYYGRPYGYVHPGWYGRGYYGHGWYGHGYYGRGYGHRW